MDRLRWADPLAGNRLVDEAIEHYVEWREESAGVEAAYRSWSSAPVIERSITFGCYTAALDREECAARAYAAALNAVARLLRTDPATDRPALHRSVTDRPYEDRARQTS